jgi:hypothetical protein
MNSKWFEDCALQLRLRTRFLNCVLCLVFYITQRFGISIFFRQVQSKGPNRVGVPLFDLMTDRDPVSEMLRSLEHQAMDKVQ